MYAKPQTAYSAAGRGACPDPTRTNGYTKVARARRFPKLKPLGLGGSEPARVEDFGAFERTDVGRWQGHEGKSFSVSTDELNLDRGARRVDVNDGTDVPRLQVVSGQVPGQDHGIKLFHGSSSQRERRNQTRRVARCL